jgi:hypothetical protein
MRAQRLFPPSSTTPSPRLVVPDSLHHPFLVFLSPCAALRSYVGLD